MGYYSELAIDDTYREDHSYPSPKLQLKWRIEDLRSRLEDISKEKYGIIAHRYTGFRYSKDDLSYTPPEYFCRESDIMDAITIAEEKLAIIEAEETEQREIGKKKTQTEELLGQLTIWDILQTKFEVLTQHEFEPEMAA